MSVEDREERLKRQLRENLKRRKAKARAAHEEDATEAAGEGETERVDRPD